MIIDSLTGPWVLLIFSLPSKPRYTRTRIARRLQRTGALALRDAVYVLPPCGPAREDFAWLAREIEREGGKAIVCETQFVAGLTDEQLVDDFKAARAADYAELAEEAREAVRVLPGPHRVSPSVTPCEETTVALGRLKARLAEVAAIDFFGAPGRNAVDDALGELAGRLEPPRRRGVAEADLAALQGRVWVTLGEVQVDRLASAWLIQRFFDARARFKFVPRPEASRAADEVGFAMGEAEFAADEARCTFEVLVKRLGLDHVGLRALVEIVHDLDREDGKFSRAETPGLALVLSGIAAAHPEVEACRMRCAALFDEVFDALQRSTA